MAHDDEAARAWAAGVTKTLLALSRVALERVVRESVDSGNPYNNCRHCLTSWASWDDTPHAEWCVITEIRTLLDHMTKVGY